MSEYETMSPPLEVVDGLQKLIASGKDLPRDHYPSLKVWRKNVIDFVQESFVEDIVEAKFSETFGLQVRVSTFEGEVKSFSENLPRAMKFLRLLIAELSKDDAPNEQDSVVSVPPQSAAVARLGPKVFIVHGHSNEVRLEVSRLLESLGLEPIVLSEQPNSGKTVIEKFEAYADVGFAVVLMTGDDFGGVNGQESVSLRARQNVILELGYFFSALKRERVYVLKSEGVEAPSDILGIVYEPIDDRGLWKYSLAKELLHAGYDISLNDVR